MSDSDHKILVCVLPSVPLRAEPNDCSEQVSQILAGEIVFAQDEECKGNWMLIDSLEDGYTGYADPRHFHSLETGPNKNDRSLIHCTDSKWKRNGVKTTIPAGSYVYWSDFKYYLGNHEIIPLSENPIGDAPYSISEAAKNFLGTPYHWGGRTISGIDCSGLTQISARLTGLCLLRDASDQAEQGSSVEWENRSVNDLGFFQNETGKITHVGILTAINEIIHASGEVRIDGLTQEGIIHASSGTLTHKFSHLRRLSIDV